MEPEKKHYEVSVENLDSKKLYLLEMAFGSDSVVSRGKDHIVVISSKEKVEEVIKTYDWIDGYKLYTTFIRFVSGE